MTMFSNGKAKTFMKIYNYMSNLDLSIIMINIINTIKPIKLIMKTQKKKRKK